MVVRAQQPETTQKQTPLVLQESQPVRATAVWHSWCFQSQNPIQWILFTNEVYCFSASPEGYCTFYFNFIFILQFSIALTIKTHIVFVLILFYSPSCVESKSLQRKQTYHWHYLQASLKIQIKMIFNEISQNEQDSCVFLCDSFKFHACNFCVWGRHTCCQRQNKIATNKEMIFFFVTKGTEKLAPVPFCATNVLVASCQVSNVELSIGENSCAVFCALQVNRSFVSFFMNGNAKHTGFVWTIVPGCAYTWNEQDARLAGPVAPAFVSITLPGYAVSTLSPDASYIRITVREHRGLVYVLHLAGSSVYDFH